VHVRLLVRLHVRLCAMLVHAHCKITVREFVSHLLVVLCLLSRRCI